MRDTITEKKGGGQSKFLFFSILIILLLSASLFSDFKSVLAFFSTPRTDTVGVNGTVFATAVGSDGTIYIGGQFDSVVTTPDLGGGVAVDPLTALPDLNSRAKTNGTVAVVVADGGGGWYIGGNFSTVADVPRYNIAHINSDGTLDQNFDPSTDNLVNGLALNGSTLYATGNFLNVNTRTTPVARKRAAAFNISTGVATSWDPSMNSNPSGVFIASSTAYIFGSGFTQVNMSTTPTNRQYGIAAFDLTNGTVTSWTPALGGPGATKIIYATASSDTIYAGGIFTSASVNGGTSYTRKSLVAYNLLDGEIKTSFAAGVTDPQFTLQAPPVQAIAVSSTTVYIGGIFEVASSTVTTPTRVNLAAFDLNGVVTNWNPDVTVTGTGNNAVPARNIAVNSNGVYVTVNTTNVNISTNNTPRRGFAMFDFVNGTVLSWNPDPICGYSRVSSCTGALYGNLGVAGDKIYITGINYVAPWTERKGLAAIDPNTGQITSWNPNVIVNALNPGGVYSIAVSDDTLYAGGQFTTVNGATTRNGLAAFNLTDGTATAWNPNVNVGVGSHFVRSIALNSTNLYAGGWFTSVNGGTTRNNLASFNLTDGTVTSWNPDVDTDGDPSGFDDYVRSIALSSDTLYAGGIFHAVNVGSTNTTRYNLAAFNLTDGTVTSWNPSIHNSPITDTNWATTTGGDQFTLALKTDGTLWSWGCDCYGELIEHEEDSSDPVQVGTDTWISISASKDEADTLAIKSDGTLWAAGANDFGQLGLGDTAVIHRNVTQVGVS